MIRFACRRHEDADDYSEDEKYPNTDKFNTRAEMQPSASDPVTKLKQWSFFVQNRHPITSSHSDSVHTSKPNSTASDYGFQRPTVPDLGFIRPQCPKTLHGHGGKVGSNQIHTQTQ